MLTSPSPLLQVDDEPFNPDYTVAERVLDMATQEEANGEVSVFRFGAATLHPVVCSLPLIRAPHFLPARVYVSTPLSLCA